MNTHIQNIENQTQNLRDQLTNHRLYKLLNDIHDIKIFMESHIYAVWDFMSIVKSLQNELTCTQVPWKPSKNPRTAQFINEIVLGEETDIDQNGNAISHFEMYLQAMKEVGANTNNIIEFLKQIENLDNIINTIKNSPLKTAQKIFLNFTFQTILKKEIHQTAAIFTFGREDLIPDLFIEILNKSNKENPSKFPKLYYYLNRHIEVDGDHHGPLALDMIQELCGNDPIKWQQSLEVSQKALESRIKLWDEIADAITQDRLSR